jgi:hypothetical protein
MLDHPVYGHTSLTHTAAPNCAGGTVRGGSSRYDDEVGNLFHWRINNELARAILSYKVNSYKVSPSVRIAKEGAVAFCANRLRSGFVRFYSIPIARLTNPPG